MRPQATTTPGSIRVLTPSSWDGTIFQRVGPTVQRFAGLNPIFKPQVRKLSLLMFIEFIVFKADGKLLQMEYQRLHHHENSENNVLPGRHIHVQSCYYLCICKDSFVTRGTHQNQNLKTGHRQTLGNWINDTWQPRIEPVSAWNGYGSFGSIKKWKSFKNNGCHRGFSWWSRFLEQFNLERHLFNS